MTKTKESMMISNFNYDELIQLYRRIQSGSFQEEVEDCITEKQETQAKVCAVCGEKCVPSQAPFTVEFGPQELRQRATVCAVDCLTYLCDQLRERAESQSLRTNGTKNRKSL